MRNIHDRSNFFDPSALGIPTQRLTVESVDQHDLALVSQQFINLPMSVDIFCISHSH